MEAASLGASVALRISRARLLLSYARPHMTPGVLHKELWADVQQLRLRMDYAGAVKEPGYSWIEVMKEVHIFIATGTEHPQAELIYAVLDDLTGLLKDFGYHPDTSELALLGETG